VIAFGCTARSALRAVRDARDAGIPAGFIRLISIWPFPEKLLQEIKAQAEAFVVAELNLGQMIHEVERHVTQPVLGVQHAGGAMLPPEPILQAIKEAANHGNA
jgi:2-oxoglutarate ferredoxin oxidoreductase subunit alpha